MNIERTWYLYNLNKISSILEDAQIEKGSHYFDLVLITENSVNKNSTPSKNESYLSLLFQYFVCKFSHSTDMNGSE